MTATGTYLAALFSSDPALQAGIDLTIKSVLVVTAHMLAYAVLRRRSSSAGRHLLWVNCFLCLALLPVSSLLSSPDGAGWLFNEALVALSAPETHQGLGPSTSTALAWSGALVLGYVLIVSYLLLRVLSAVIRIQLISKRSWTVLPPAVADSAERVNAKLRGRRRVLVAISRDIDSPVSFGLLTPRILLPVQALGWSNDVLIDVLIHEFSHIRRLDWSTSLVGYCLAALYWPNPLVWRALKNMKAEAEGSCDESVVACGRCGVHYASNLLFVARNCRVPKNSAAVVQTAVNRSTLACRVRNLLEDSDMRTTNRKKLLSGLAVLSLTILVLSGTGQFLSAQGDSLDMIPLEHVMPSYPRAAAEEGVQGWVLLEFTVDTEGTVVEDSIRVVDREPSAVFDRPAIDATRQFRFDPRAENGRAVPVDDVSYLFRFHLDSSETTPEGQRPPPRQH